MIDFANYAFNKSHAAAYAVVAFQTAYLKRYYPVEFMAALLNSFVDNTDKVAFYVQVLKKMGIQVLPPDINESYSYFTVVNGKIRFGLAAVKNVGLNATLEIVEDRKKKGRYTSIIDFFERIDEMQLNKKAVESLIKAGAFDSFGVYRSQLLAVYEGIMESIHRSREKNIKGQISLFESDEESHKIDYSLPDIKEFSKGVILSMEKETMGLYISGHPLDEYQDDIQRIANCTTRDLKNSDDSFAKKSAFDDQDVVLVGIVENKKIKFTKNNNMMAFVNLADLYGTIEVIVFPAVYERYSKFLSEDLPVIIKGKVSLREDEEPKILCDEVEPLTHRIREKLWLNVKEQKDVEKIKGILTKYKGNIPVFIRYANKNLAAQKDLWVNGANELLDELASVLGKENVKIV
jgi:DNA polymerase-3 subunit alpha